MSDFDQARALLRQFKGGTPLCGKPDSYLFGTGVLSSIGKVVAAAGDRAALVHDTFGGSGYFVRVISDSLSESEVELVGEI